jgi:hypothetical protein
MKLKTVLLTLALITGLLVPIKSGESTSRLDSNDPNPFNINYIKLYEQIILSGVKFPEIVFAQAVLESAHFKSSLFTRASNLFGMKVPTKRESTAIGSTNGYSKYENWHESIYDYKLWQEFLFSKRGELSKTEYFAYLKKWYAADTKYVTKVQKKMKEFSFIFDRYE